MPSPKSFPEPETENLAVKELIYTANFIREMTQGFILKNEYLTAAE